MPAAGEAKAERYQILPKPPPKACCSKIVNTSARLMNAIKTQKVRKAARPTNGACTPSNTIVSAASVIL